MRSAASMSSCGFDRSLRLARSRLLDALNQCPLSGVKRTWRFQSVMSAFDPRCHPCRTWIIGETHLKKLAPMLDREHDCIEIGNLLLTLLRNSKVAQGISEISPD